jgi:hypothetical protein
MTLARVTIAALLLSGCDSLLDLRVQTDSLCVPTVMQSFSGGASMLGPFTLPGTSTKTVTIDFSKPLKQLPGEQAGLDLDVRLDQVFIRSTGDLSFVKRVKVSLAPGTEMPSTEMPLQPVYIGEYVKSPTATAPITELKVQSVLNSNVVKYLEDEPARLMFTATGRLPADAFMADVEACVFVQSHATY